MRAPLRAGLYGYWTSRSQQLNPPVTGRDKGWVVPLASASTGRRPERNGPLGVRHTVCNSVGGDE